MKKALVLVLLTGFVGTALANCGNGGSNGEGCENNGQQGPQGPAGPQGQNGANGTNGTNGTNGQNGATGPAAPVKAAMIAGIELRLFDTRYVSMFAFDDYQLDPQPSHDLIGGGARNSAYGTRLMFKLGPDYTQSKIDELNRKLDAVQRQLGMLAQ